jgi:hypothetical protein
MYKGGDYAEKGWRERDENWENIREIKLFDIREICSLVVLGSGFLFLLVNVIIYH